MKVSQGCSTYADGFIDHRLDPLARLDRTRTDSFRPAFTEQTSHTRFVRQTKLASVLFRNFCCCFLSVF